MLLLLGIATTPTLAAEPAAGLVLQVTGATTPRLARNAEIAADSAVRLGTGATLTFLHYERCKQVTVAGGTVILTRTDFATDGRTVGETALPCPVVQDLKGDGAPARWPSRPDIVLTGPHAGRVGSVTIVEDGRLEPAGLRLEIGKGRAALPAGAALRANVRYRLRVRFTDRTPAADMAFTAGAEASLVVLRTP